MNLIRMSAIYFMLLMLTSVVVNAGLHFYTLTNSFFVSHAFGQCIYLMSFVFIIIMKQYSAGYSNMYFLLLAEALHIV